MTDDRQTLVDKFWNKIKNNRILAVVIVMAGVVAGVASFSDSVTKIARTADDIIPDRQNTEVVEEGSITGVSSFENYFNKNFQISDYGESDIVNLSKDDIIIDFSLNNGDGDLKYILKKDKDRLIINPYNRYLLLLQNGGPVRPLDYYHTPFDFEFPTLDFKVINNSGKTIFFTKAIVSVAKSKPDPFPILVMHTGYEMDFPIENIGWGKVYNCKVRFNLVTDNDHTPPDFKGRYKFEMNIGNFSTYAENNSLSRYFETLGVKTKVLAQRYLSATFAGDETSYTILDDNGHEKTITGKEYEKRISDALGPFRSGSALMYGEISYEGINASGKLMTEKLKFEDKINLGERGAGAPAPPSFVYDLMLEANKTNYRKQIPLSQAIKPNEFDRFNIKIAAPVSSRHQFNVTLFYNDNREFTIRNLSLNYFMSRPDSTFIYTDKNPPRE